MMGVVPDRQNGQDGAIAPPLAPIFFQVCPRGLAGMYFKSCLRAARYYLPTGSTGLARPFAAPLQRGAAGYFTHARHGVLVGLISRNPESGKSGRAQSLRLMYRGRHWVLKGNCA